MMLAQQAIGLTFIPSLSLNLSNLPYLLNNLGMLGPVSDRARWWWRGQRPATAVTPENWEDTIYHFKRILMEE